MEQDSGLFIRRIVNDVSDAIIASDPDFGIVEWNPAAEKMYGFTREEARGKGIFELARREYIGTTREEALEEFHRTGSWQGEVFDHSKDGQRMHVLTRVSEIHGLNDEFIGIVAVNRDITQQRQKEQMEKRHREMYRLIAEATATCTRREDLCQFIVDEMAAILNVRTVMLQIKGTEPGNQCSCYSSGAPENLIEAMASDTMIEKTLYHRQETIHVPDLLEFQGSAIWLDMLKTYGYRSILAFPIRTPEMDPIGAVCILSERPFNVCKGENSHMANFSHMIATSIYRVTSEETSHRQERKLKTIFAHIVDVFFRITPDGILTDVSNSGVRLFGFENSESIVGKNIKDLVFLRPSGFTDFMKEIQRSGSLNNFDFRARTQAGFILDLEVNARTECDESGQIKFIEGIIRDITRRKQIEDELREKVKLENMNFLIGSVAHSFNNNLTAILGSISVSQHYAGSHEKLTNFLKKAETGCLKAKQTVQQLMMISGSIRPICRSMSIEPVIRNVINDLKQTCDTNFHVSGLNDLPAIKGNEKQIQQIFTHVLNNSIESMNGEGTISISTDIIESHLSGPNSVPAQMIHIEVTDTGKGMDEDTLKHVFEPFYTTDSTSQGLGLSVSRSIIRRMDGSINVESKPGKGTSVNLNFPIFIDPKSNPEYVDTLHILVLDPSDLVRQVCLDLIRELGYIAEGVESGTDCLREYRTNLDNGYIFDIVFIDLGNLKSNTGPAILKMIRKINPDVKAVATTVYGDHPVIKNYTAFGFDARLIKPFRLSSIEDVIQSIT